MTDRRQFLTTIVAAGAAAAATPARAADEATPPKPSALPPNEYVAAAETRIPSEILSLARCEPAACQFPMATLGRSWSTSCCQSTSSRR